MSTLDGLPTVLLFLPSEGVEEVGNYKIADTNRAFKRGRKEGIARDGGDRASGGKSNRGTGKTQGSKSLRRLTYEKCVEISKGVAGMGTLQQKSPGGKSAGSLVVVV